MSKKELRTKYKGLRQQLSASEIEDKSLAIANRLLELDIWDHSFYHIFLPITTQHEVNTEYILNVLQGKDKNVVLSKSNFDDLSMAHYLLTDTTIIKSNAYNIPEPTDGIVILPQQIDVVFVPLLAFDTQGHRIGYGKGFYDRFLTECKLDTLKIGLSFFEAEPPFSEVDDTDIRLDYAVTVDRVYRF